MTALMARRRKMVTERSEIYQDGTFFHEVRRCVPPREGNHDMKQRIRITATACLCVAVPLGLGGFVWLAGVDLKRLFLRTAGLVVGGVKDDVGVVAAVSIILMAIVWLVIIARAMYEMRLERRAKQIAKDSIGNPESDASSIFGS